MNLDKLYMQQRAQYETSVRLYGPNAKKSRQLYQELQDTLHRRLRRDNRKGNAA